MSDATGSDFDPRPIPLPSQDTEPAKPIKKRFTGVTAIVLVIVLVVSGAVLVNANGEGSPPTGDVELASATSRGADPFIATVAAPLPTDTKPAPPFPPRGAPAPSITPTTPVRATQSGLYGAVEFAASCNALELIHRLREDDTTAGAWAEAQGIPASEIEHFVATLTPAYLRVDTQVTSAAERDGEVSHPDLVLQAGTAVLVDPTGLPRVNCNNGNPLDAARPVRTPTYHGFQWPAFDPTKIVTPQPGPAQARLVLVDVTTGNPFVRRVGTGGSADVAVAKTSAIADPIGHGAVKPASLASQPSSSSSDTIPDPTPGSPVLDPEAAAALRKFFGGGISLSGSTIQVTVPTGGVDGPATGQFSVTLIVDSAACNATVILFGDLTGERTGSSVAGRWSGEQATTFANGDCARGAPESRSGSWRASFAAGTGTGVLSINGSPLLDFVVEP